MALQHSFTTSQGIELATAYTRINAIKHTHDTTAVDVDVFASESARLADKSPVSRQSYSIPWADSVSLTGAYNALKALDEYSGALDV